MIGLAMKAFISVLRVLLGLFLLVIAGCSVMIVSLMTAFAGSTHNPPSGYLLYITVAQALPILVYSIACLIISGCVVIAKPVPIIAFKMFGISVLIYFLSWLGIVALGVVTKF